MTFKAAVEVDTMIIPIEAAIDTLNVIHAYFCDDEEPLSSTHVRQLGNALYTVERALTTLTEEYQAKVDVAFEERKKEDKRA